jgi:hypothetical protein
LSFSYSRFAAILPRFCFIIESAVAVRDAHSSAKLMLYQVVTLKHYCFKTGRKIKMGAQLVYPRKRSECFGVECSMNSFLKSSVCADYLYERVNDQN